MKLSDLLKFNDIVVQCHDIPDADSIASGFCIYTYLKSFGKKVRLIYSGKEEIKKVNLLMFICKLDIPIEYAKEIPAPQLLITVDCQYGEGNVTRFNAQNVAIIDHHQVCVKETELVKIRPSYGSCCTLVYTMLCDEGYKIDLNLSIALYYGLYMDTNGFSEIKHPSDMDVLEHLTVDEALINELKSSNFSMEELEIAGRALLNYYFNAKKNFAIVKTEECDPNLLGFISDLIIQVKEIGACVVYNEREYGFKMSVRSTIRSASANDIVKFIAEETGSGGGHKLKAGGLIVRHLFEKKFRDIPFEDYLKNRFFDYFQSYEIINTTTEKIDILSMKKYKKLPIVVGFSKTLDFAEAGTPLLIRTFEGDVTVVADDDIYIMIGIVGEVYPIKKEVFLKKYKIADKPYNINSEYPPKVYNKRTEDIFPLMHCAKSCVNTEESYIFAKKIDRTTKVFTAWNYDNYMLGNKGDYLAISNTSEQDAYIITNEVFKITYKSC